MTLCFEYEVKIPICNLHIILVSVSDVKILKSVMRYLSKCANQIYGKNTNIWSAYIVYGFSFYHDQLWYFEQG